MCDLPGDAADSFVEYISHNSSGNYVSLLKGFMVRVYKNWPTVRMDIYAFDTDIGEWAAPVLNPDDIEGKDKFGSPHKYPEWVASMSFTAFAGCECAVVISHDSYVSAKWQGKGLGKMLLRLREQALERAKVSQVLATVRDDNAKEIHLLESAGWKRLADWKGRYYGGRASLWGKTLDA